jgi:signal transduction histidine kinase
MRWGAVVAGLRSLAGPRPVVLVSAGLLVVLVVAAFGYEFVSSAAGSRRQAERSLAAQAAVTSELTSSLVTASATSVAAQATHQFGGSRLDGRALTVLVRRSPQLAYAFVADGSGRVVAVSAGAPRGVGGSSAVRGALAGHVWLSNLLSPGAHGAGVVELAVSFRTPLGRRVLVEGLEAKFLVGFLHAYLGQPSGGAVQVSYLVDANDRVIVDSGGPRPGERLPAAVAAGGRVRVAGVERYVASSPLAGSDWRVLLSEPTARLYPALVGGRGWLLKAVLAALGLIGLTCLVFLHRTLVRTGEAEEANRRLAELNATLEERVAERTAVAEQRARELERSNDELEQFASVASHDLQEPLRKIRMYGGRLPKRLAGPLGEEAASDLARMENAAERMQRLIDDLLSFARVGSRHRDFEPVALDSLVGEVVGDLEARIEELGARIDVGPLPVVSGDRAQLSQLLQNLLSNGLKFHREGVAPLVKVRAELVDGERPRFGAESPRGARCVLTVSDNGIGFDPKYSERVFSAFERLHSRSDYEGTGIGLSIARKIAWRHRGELTATSTPGEGSTFTLTLPLPAAAAASPAAEAA